LYSIFCRLRFGTAPAAEESKNVRCISAAFLNCLTQVSLVTMSHPSQRIVAPPPCLPLDIKDLLKEDVRFLDEGDFLMGGFWLKGTCKRGVDGSGWQLTRNSASLHQEF
jgi:hypothetical protein